MEDGVPPRSHKLDRLFLRCSSMSRCDLTERRRDILAVLKRNASHFECARYHHEADAISLRPQELLQVAVILSQYVRTEAQAATPNNGLHATGADAPLHEA
jgi:hypothetical protein